MAVHVFRFEDGSVLRFDSPDKNKVIKKFINANMAEWAEENAYDCDDQGAAFLNERQRLLKIIRNAKYEAY